MVKRVAPMPSSMVSRISRLAATDIDRLLADEPERRLDPVLRAFGASIAEAEQVLAQTVGSVRLLEDDLRQAKAAELDWRGQARAASEKAAELTAVGRTSEADRYEELARIALRRQIGFGESAATLQVQIAGQARQSDQLKEALATLRGRRDEIARRRDVLRVSARDG